MVVVAVKDKVLQVRLDHGAGCLKFGDATALETDHMRTQLTLLAQQMQKVVQIVTPRAAADAVSATGQGNRSAFFSLVRSSEEKEHSATLNRKNIIERRKEANERKEKEMEKLAEIQAAEVRF